MGHDSCHNDHCHHSSRNNGGMLEFIISSGTSLFSGLCVRSELIRLIKEQICHTKNCHKNKILCLLTSFLNSLARKETRWLSKSSPPRKVSPLVDLTSNTPFWISRMEISNVPPPRSYTAILQQNKPIYSLCSKSKQRLCLDWWNLQHPGLRCITHTRPGSWPIQENSINANSLWIKLTKIKEGFSDNIFWKNRAGGQCCWRGEGGRGVCVWGGSRLFKLVYNQKAQLRTMNLEKGLPTIQNE